MFLENLEINKETEALLQGVLDERLVQISESRGRLDEITENDQFYKKMITSKF